MSKGLGRVERGVIDALSREPLGRGCIVTPERGVNGGVPLAAALYGTDPTEAQLAALRRAVRSLERKGIVHHEWVQGWKIVYLDTGDFPRRREELASLRGSERYVYLLALDKTRGTFVKPEH